MADALAAERAYDHLKRSILKGAIAAGPMDIRRLGDRLKMSGTPIREALARLSAERIVRQTPHYGYEVESPSARRLEQLYDLIGWMLDRSLEKAGDPRWAAIVAPERTSLGTLATYAEVMSELVKVIAAAQTNVELSDHILAINDRLFQARMCEPRVLTGLDEEVSALSALWDRRNLNDLRIVLRQHHATRLERVDAIARCVAEPVGRP